MSIPLRVLMLESSQEAVSRLAAELRGGGYGPDCLLVDRPETMAAALAEREWDLVIAEYALPRLGALEALKMVQAKGLDLPFIIVSGTAGEERAMEVMKAGAHDYILKGNLARLVPAVAREMREAAGRRDRARTWEALRKSESEFKKMSREFHALLETIPDNLTLQSPELVVLWANKGAARGLGKEVAELIGRHCYALWHQRSVPCDPCPVRRSFTSGTPEIIETVTPDGRVWELRTSPIKDENGTVTSVVEIGREITARRQAENQIRASLREKELLLKEVHHRVKNNMQLISSLLNLQASYISDPGALEVFRDSQSRVKSMAIVHEQLYQSRDLSRIDFAQYVRNLAAHIFRSFGEPSAGINLQITFDQVFLSVDNAIPCGLIVNELVTNAIKHAFAGGRRGEIGIGFAVRGDGTNVLTVRDNGIGLPRDIDTKKTLGLQLVNMLGSQLGGSVTWNVDAGTEFVVAFQP